MVDLSQKVNVVIPVHRDAEALARLLAQLSGAGLEVIVVDASLGEACAAVATRAGAQVLKAKPNRGAQLHQGAGQSRLEWILFLHADSQLTEGWEQVVWDFIEGGGFSVAVFRFRLDDRRLRARLLERLVAVRCRLFGLPYGDQGLLIHRAAYLKAGGFQPLPLMEDVALIQKFTKKEICFLDIPLTTSAAKFQQRGFGRQSIKNIFLVLLYFLGVPPKRLTKFY